MAEDQKKKGEEKKKEDEKPEEPKMVSLKEVADKAGVNPREARSILRKISTRTDDQKRSRWQWPVGETNSVVSKIKASIADKEKAAEEKAAAAAEAGEGDGDDD